jgi:hypothetical protein
MAEDDGDAHTLGLLVDLRNLCRRMGDEHHRMASELHDLLRQVQSPNVHGLDKEMGYRVEQLDEKGDPEGWPELFRALSLNCSITLARAAFEAACKCYPTKRLVLKWGGVVVERYEPRSANK